MLLGWIEKDSRILSAAEAEMLTADEAAVCGGEFVLETKTLTARDCYGIMPSAHPAGVVTSAGVTYPVTPAVPHLSLEDAICEAVRIRCTENAVVTLSGGVDSTLVAALANLPAIAVGVEGSHDADAAEKAADALGIQLTLSPITLDDVGAALPEVLRFLPQKNPMDLELAVTGYFICRLAKQCGAERIITGQAADELFAGYARYGRTKTLREDLDADFKDLSRQRVRDSAAASHFGVWYSLPYMDERVVRCAKALKAEDLVSGELRKVALRKVAEKYIPEEFAWKPKKAMQYGSGVSKMLSRIAKQEGCRNTAELIEKIIVSEEE
ncbi:MAG: asparagine synthase [Methanocorpusculum parvum]|nr:asparagine synthase [Methanocorpusculum parvum]